ncbi:glutathione S-transferase C-terminal-like protein [Pisolithus orientalis]|uniref:glutathione S-transferase C-terminal-like protein n=1 Tax=Pisolithus orientalis TaxID=936130 RepID=UPI0022249FD6|nr:glutathione S-transferase C-terminal-like protein [Pisolithus orientalis]KAI5993069.1 glutathione S-transferase C-terminal-like protein [Pisolithus orientalis]
MAPIGKLYGHPRQPQTKAILSAATISGLEIEQVPFEWGVTNKSPEWIQKFPLGKIPTFEDNEGFRLIEGVVIARYVSSLVPEAGLLGHNRKETAQVDQWIHFAETEILIPASFIYGGIVAKFFLGYNDEQHKFYQERLERSLKFLEGYLASRSSGLLVKDILTLGDIVLATAVERAGQTICGIKEREQVYTHTFAHFAKVTNDERIKHLFGEPGFVDKPLVFKGD